MRIRHLPFILVACAAATNTLAELPNVNHVCTMQSGKYRVDRVKLLYWALEQSGVSNLCLIDPVTNTFPDPAALIRQLNKTTNDEDFYISSACHGKEESAAHYKAVGKLPDVLGAFTDTQAGPLSNDAPFQLMGINENEDEISEFGLYFLNPGDTYIACFKEDQEDNDGTMATPKPTYNILFRESLDEFAKAEFSDAKGGRIVYESLDDDDDSSTNSSQFVLGVRINSASDGKKFLGFIDSVTPYLSFNASKVVTDTATKRTTERKEEREVGISFKSVYSASRTWNHYVDTALGFQDERYLDTQVAHVSLLYTPSSQGRLNDWVAFRHVNMYPKFNLQVKYSDVRDEGNLSAEKIEELNDSQQYTALGSSVGITLKSKNIKYDKTELSLEYSYFGLQDHQESSTDLTTIALTHFLDTAKHYGIEFSYEKGEDGVFIDEIDKWNISFSARY